MKALRFPLALAAILSAAMAALPAQAPSFRNTIQDFRPGVIDFRPEGIGGCFREGVLVQPRPEELRPGDVFIDADGTARKVVQVSRVGRELWIDTVQPAFAEVYVYAEIPLQTVALSPSPDPASSKGSFDISFEKELWSEGPASIAVSASGELTSSMTVGFKAPSCVEFRIQSWKFWEWTVGFRYESGYLEAALDYDLALTGALSCSVSKSVETKPVTLYGFGSPIPGITANLGLLAKAGIEGQLAVELPFTLGFAGDASARCTLEGQVPFMVPTNASGSGTMSYSVTLEPSITAEALARLKCYLGGEVTLVGIEIAEFEAGGGPYIKVDGTLSGSIGYDSVDGLSGPEWSASASSEIGLFTEVSGSVCDGKWEMTMFSREFPFYKFFDLSTQEARR